MICHGDALGRTQDDNNNGYFGQDSELADLDRLEQRRYHHARIHPPVIAFRAAHRAFQRRRFLTGRPVRHDEVRRCPAWSG